MAVEGSVVEGSERDGRSKEEQREGWGMGKGVGKAWGGDVMGGERGREGFGGMISGGHLGGEISG